MRKLIGGAIALVASIIAMAFTYWSALDTVVTKLRSKGPVGIFIANIITSPLIHLALILAAIGLFVLAFREFRTTRKLVSPEASSLEAEGSKIDSSDSSRAKLSRSITQTMTSSPGSIQAGRDIRTKVEKRDE